MSDSDSAPLSVVRLLEELHQVTDWYMLGVYLEIPPHELDKINQQFLSEGVERCKAALITLWLKSNPKASWELIAVALKMSGEKVLSEKVRERHVVSAVLPTIVKDGSSVTVEVEEAVVDRFTDLEDNFAILVTNIKTALEEKQIPLKSLQRFLEERLEQRGEYMQATNIDELFHQISPHYCFLNTTLLKSIVNKFIGEPLQHQLKDYKSQLDEFTISTKIILLTKDPLATKFHSHHPPNTEGMPQVVLKLTGCYLDVTIEHFQKLVNKIFGAKASAMTHIRVEDGCICISWLTHESAIPSLVALAQQKVEFMRHVGVLRLTVGDITILEKEGEKEEDADLSPALLRATTAGCEEAVEFLLILGADSNFTSEDGATPLIITCEKGFVSITKMLLKVHANVNVQDTVGDTALMKVCISPLASEDLVKLLIQSGADINTKTNMGWTALMYATRRGHSNIVQLLLNEGSAFNTQNNGGVTALMLACCYSHPDIVQLLLSYGADPNIHNQYNHTALMSACSRQLTSAVELLLAHGADPNLQGFDGWTALMYACEQNNYKMDPFIPFLLLSAGGNPNAVNFNYGVTALMVAVISCYQDGVQALLRGKADIDIQDKYGDTALHFAAQEGHFSITELLLAAGASVSLVNGDDQTALDLALAGSHHDVCQLLLMHMDSEPPPKVSETEHSPQYPPDPAPDTIV